MRFATNTPVLYRLALTAAPSGDCWLWTGLVSSSGYGSIRWKGRTFSTHRLAYQLYRADIPEGLTIDHLCRQQLCMNPWHMEPVPNAVNLSRAGAAKTHCKQGHEFTAANTYKRNGHRTCRACNALAAARYKARRDAA